MNNLGKRDIVELFVGFFFFVDWFGLVGFFGLSLFVFLVGWLVFWRKMAMVVQNDLCNILAVA